MGGASRRAANVTNEMKIRTLHPSNALFGKKLEQIRFALNPEKWALDEIDRYRHAFEAGDRAALPMAIKVTGLANLGLQKWIVDAWSDACTKVFSADVLNWDSVLKNEDEIFKTHAKRKQFKAKAALTNRILELLDESPPNYGPSPTPIDERLFASLAEKLSIKDAAARKLYYAIDPRWRPRAKRKRPPPRKSNSSKTSKK
jgi:hypothetical protein